MEPSSKGENGDRDLPVADVSSCSIYASSLNNFNPGAFEASNPTIAETVKSAFFEYAAAAIRGCDWPSERCD